MVAEVVVAFPFYRREIEWRLPGNWDTWIERIAYESRTSLGHFEPCSLETRKSVSGNWSNWAETLVQFGRFQAPKSGPKDAARRPSIRKPLILRRNIGIGATRRS